MKDNRSNTMKSFLSTRRLWIRLIASLVFSFFITAIFSASPAHVFADITVTVTGPGGSASQALPDEGGAFDMELPLNRNAVNAIMVTAEDASGNSASANLAVTQVSLGPDCRLQDHLPTPFRGRSGTAGGRRGHQSGRSAKLQCLHLRHCPDH